MSTEYDRMRLDDVLSQVDDLTVLVRDLRSEIASKDAEIADLQKLLREISTGLSDALLKLRDPGEML